MYHRGSIDGTVFNTWHIKNLRGVFFCQWNIGRKSELKLETAHPGGRSGIENVT